MPEKVANLYCQVMYHLNDRSSLKQYFFTDLSLRPFPAQLPCDFRENGIRICIRK